MRQDSGPGQNNDFSPWKIYLDLYLRNISANLLGFAIILLLIVFTPPAFARIREIEQISAGGWEFLLLIFPFLLGIIAFFQYYFQCPVCSILIAKKNAQQCERYSQEKIQKRTLNLPLNLAMVNMAIYLVAPMVIILVFWFLDLPVLDLRGTRLLFFRTVMIGLTTSCLSFFIVESYSRRVLIPMVFPAGNLSTIPGAIRINALRRIRLFYLAGALTPMIILVVTLFFVIQEVTKNPNIPNQPAVDIFWFTLVLCTIFVIIGFRLNVLVGRSIAQPLESMLQVVEKVEKGDFTQQIKNVANDEIGVLAEAGNRMIKGLAERERVRELFGRYVTPEIRDKILSGQIPLDGERKIASMLFCDLRDFSSYVEENSPEEVILSMREYFTAMEEAIRKNKGLILQYVGDEIEAVFGVPLEMEDHADKALNAALEMKRQLVHLNRNRQAKGKPAFKQGIGICSGPVLAGNTGSKNQPSYALIGDTVNKASRLQELTKELDAEILISSETRDLLQQAYNLQEKGPCFIKGHVKPIMVYELRPHG